MDKPPRFDKLFQDDPYLKDFESDLLLRWNKLVKLESAFDNGEGGLAEFAKGFKQYGIVQERNGDVKVIGWCKCPHYNIIIADLKNCVNCIAF